MNFLLDSDIDEIVNELGDTTGAFSGKTVLITGGRGFLGRYFVATFAAMNASSLESPVNLIVLDNLITAGAAGESAPEIDHVEFIDHDVTKVFEPDREIDYIINAAGIASPFYYRKFPLETLDVAVTGTRNMLDVARTHGAKILYFSSSEIYGDPDAAHVPTTESYNGNVSSLGARAVYDESKRLGETLAKVYHDEFGVKSRIVRPFNVYGPGMQKTDYRVLPNFVGRALDSKALKVYGHGNQTRTFCYATDAIRGFLLVLLDGIHGEPYNIGNPEPEIAMVDLAERVTRSVGSSTPVDIVEYPDSYPASEPQRRCPDISKAQLQLGYRPLVGLDEGIERFVGWARAAYL